MLYTVSTVKESVAGLERFVARNLAGGVDHVILFVDDFDPVVTATLDKNPHVTAIATGPNWWHGKRPRQLNARQRINANVAKAVLAAVADRDDWLFHIDGDEALQVDRAALAALGPDVDVVRLPPLEAVSRAKWPGGKVTHFKKMLAPEELTLLHVLGVIDEPTNGHYFHGHCEGKSGVRPVLDRWITLHAVHDVDQEQVDAAIGVGRMLHYESWSGEEFVRKWLNILDSGSKVSFRPVREPTAVALRSLVRRDLPKRTVRKYLLKIFERTTEDDFETLRDLELLEEVDPLAGTHRAEQRAPDLDAEVRALLAAIEPENKWPFHTGRTAGNMVATLALAADRLEPGLAARVRPRWTLPDELLRGHDSGGEVELVEDQGSE
jgi:Glycosyl transferase family 2